MYSFSDTKWTDYFCLPSSSPCREGVQSSVSFRGLWLAHLPGSLHTRYKYFHFLAAQEGLPGVAMVTLEHLVASVFTDREHGRDISLTAQQRDQGSEILTISLHT